MIDVQINDKALKRNLERAAKQTPVIAQDAMAYAMFGLRKSWLQDLQPRIPGLVRARKGGRGWIWWAKAYVRSNGDVVGRLKPRAYAKRLALLETGGTVYPKKRKYLAVPIGAARTASGKVKRGYSTPESYERHKGRLALIKSNKGLFLAKKLKSGKAGKLLFALKKSVRVPPILGLGRFWARGDIRDAFFERIRKGLTKNLRRVLAGKTREKATFRRVTKGRR